MFFLPYGHDARVKRDVPWITIAIAGGCIAAWVLTVTAGSAPAGFSELAANPRVPAEYANNPSAIPIFNWGLISAKATLVTVFSSAFMHGGLVHLAGNLLFLMLTAPYLEDEWGKTGFGLFYVFAILVSAASWLYAYPDSSVPLVGASGAISACMGAFTLKFGWSNMKVFYWIFPWNFVFRTKMVGVATLPAWTVLALWFAQQGIYAANFGTSEAGGTAYIVHFGGFLGGILLTLALKGFRLDTTVAEPLEPAFPTQLGPDTEPAFPRAA